MLRPGEIFAGYVIQRELGRGGMGAVYLARHPRLPRWIALKLLNAEFHGDTETHARFEREADLAARLNHPSIVTVYDRGVEDGRLWIAMQYIDGVEAEAMTDLTPEQAVEIVTATADALDYAHRVGVLHRDVKPANILLARETREQQAGVLLTDFGIARLQEDTGRLTGSGSVMATLAYASPEQLQNLPVGPRSDQYSLACTLFRLLTGIPLFPAADLGAIVKAHLYDTPPSIAGRRPGLPAALDPVLARALAKNPDDRYPSCSEFAAAARRALAVGDPVGSATISIRDKSPEVPARRAKSAAPGRRGGAKARAGQSEARAAQSDTRQPDARATQSGAWPVQAGPGRAPSRSAQPVPRPAQPAARSAQPVPRSSPPTSRAAQPGAPAARRPASSSVALRSGRLTDIPGLFGPPSDRHPLPNEESKSPRAGRKWLLVLRTLVLLGVCLAAALGLAVFLVSPSGNSEKPKAPPADIADISAAFPGLVPRTPELGSGFTGASCRVADHDTKDFLPPWAFDGWNAAWDCQYSTDHEVREYVLFAYASGAVARSAATRIHPVGSTLEDLTFKEFCGKKEYTNHRFDSNADVPSTAFATTFFDDPAREKFILYTRGTPNTPTGIVDWWKSLPLT
ncbi:serine/threonine protein kinase [Nocardia yunnanensis]|uniref:non-specific serine/threonine protein kinase n=1 Tax=Nocardia yunnanensis TaxID=2382165 RepID=A0A386ZKX2_9NOCA|nr:serine/threonine-protein kinase [Nocardia yunnanensis]AYF77279.1 serine/threonine protein kinase [Nocardia yunnanensis]